MLPSGTVDILRNQILKKLDSKEYIIGSIITLPLGVSFYWGCPIVEKDGQASLTLTWQVIEKLRDDD